MYRLTLFGSASIEGPDGAVTGRPVQRRRLGLLALLARARRSGVTRDKLIGYLWPDSDPERARHLLSDSIYRINQAVGGEALIATGDRLRLNPDRLPSDAWDFADAVERGDWERVVELHAGPFLDGFFLTDADELERWVDAQRERLARDRDRALDALAEAAERAGDLRAALQWWGILAERDPYSSRIALRLMRALDRTGDRAAALQHARVHTQLLEQEMGAAPDAELLAFVAELRTPVPGLEAPAEPRQQS
ncbi:MAG: AfsR/SARP family transcriptional regulator, partial [Longimicrobiales bacterium]